MKVPTQKPIEFDAFFRITLFLFDSVSLKPYGHTTSKLKAIASDVIFCLHVITVNVVTFFEAIYVYVSLRANVDTNRAMVHFSFVTLVIITNSKLYRLRSVKREMDKLINELRYLFPSDMERQRSYDLQRYCKRYTRLGAMYAYLFLVLVWAYNMRYLLPHLVLDRWFNVLTVEIELPFLIWLPWEARSHWTYPIIYFLDMMAGHAAVVSNIVGDLLMCGIAIQLTMHFDYIATIIMERLPNGAMQSNEDLAFLKYVIAYHDKVQRLSEDMNFLFGSPLLINFIISSLTLCLVAFGVASQLTVDLMILMVVFMIVLLAQVYIISSYSQNLKIASEAVGDAAYNHQWFDADVRYKKMLVLIIKSSQKPSMIKATNFLAISLRTVTSVLEISYKMFSVLRHLYADT